MNSTSLARQEQPLAAQIEQVVISGDLKNLQPTQRVDYYNRVCQSVGLNPYTRPFEYITLNGKLTLYARRDAADQLRSLHGISLSKPHIDYKDDMVIVTVEAVDREGRTDTDLGAVNIKNLQGEARANAIMKAITKAKRRVTLSLAGLGWLDETEVDTIPGAQHVTVDTETGEIVDGDVDFYKAPETSQDAQEATSGNGTLDSTPDAVQSAIYAHLIDKLTGDCLERANRARRIHAQSRGPASSEQYRFLAGTIDDLVRQVGGHKAVLEVFVGRAVSSANPPGTQLAGKLLDALLETRAVEQDGEKVKEPNPDYNPEAVTCVHAIWHLVREQDGQGSLFDQPQKETAQ